MNDFWNGFLGATLSLKADSVNRLYGGLPSFAFLLGVLAQYVLYFGFIYYLVFKEKLPSESYKDYLKRRYRFWRLKFRSERALRFVFGLIFLFWGCFAYVQTVNMVQTVTTYVQYATKTKSRSTVATVRITGIHRGTSKSATARIDGFVRIGGKASRLHIVNANKRLANAFLQDGSENKSYTAIVYLDQDGQPYAVASFLAE